MLPYDLDVLTVLIETYNRDIWPVQIAAVLLATAVLGMAARPFDGASRMVGLVLTAGWVFSGVAFHLIHFAPYNFAAPVYGWCFLAQAALLLWALVIRNRVSFRMAFDGPGWAALIMAALAMAVAPVGEAVLGAGVAAVELPGLMPDPTAVFTLAILTMVRGRTPVYLIVLPFLWSLVAAATALMLEAPGALTLPFAGIAGTAVVLWKNRRAAT